MRGSDPYPFGADCRVLALFHGEIVHVPERCATEHIRDAGHAMTLQHLGGLHTTMATLADHQDIAVGRNLAGSMTQLTERNIRGPFGMTTRVFPALAYIDQGGGLVRA